MRLNVPLTASALALAAAISTSPASAQEACDINGAAQTAPTEQDTLTCGTPGVFSFSTGDDSTSLGVDSNVIFDNATAIGSNSFAGAGSAAVFIPVGYFPPGDAGATAVGAYSYAAGEATVAIGNEAGVGLLTANPDGSFSVGTVDFGTAIGSFALVTGENGTAVGANAEATGSNATAIGQGSSATNFFATAVGQGAEASGNSSTAIGALSEAAAQSATAVGWAATAAIDSTALGSAANADGDESTALGRNAQAVGDFSTAVGENAIAQGVSSVAIGRHSNASAPGGTAVGESANAATLNSTSLGLNANASQANSTALGANASAVHANSVAIGAGTVTTATNQVNVGGRTIAGVNAGVLGTDAVNVSQLTAATAGIAADISGLEAMDAILSSRIGDVDDRSRSGTAVAIAMGGAAFLPDKQFNVTGNLGFYRSAWAGAMNINALVGTNAAINAGIGAGFNKKGKIGGRVGFTFGW